MGSQNKLGTYLLLWKLDRELSEIAKSLGPRNIGSLLGPKKKLQNWQKKSIAADGNIESSYQCDMALLGIVKIMAQINKHQNIREYRSHYDLKRFIDEFSVSVQFFVHKGDATEGTIGSHYKIDASYLSQDIYFT